ncbi:MAG TPA: type I-E CRISPR-associated protein Cas6/Cse3/CasE [Candidatus Thermoplasmatota archaeon]|nr:type I-E CRISPR-associated protein Cas6/Cse3/CasE [Candidatus Thermoplasmatota archaeon]
MQFTRITLVDPESALSNIANATAYGHHQQIWSFFAGDPDGERGFVYRYDAERQPTFHVVSDREPTHALPGWRVESRAYTPRLEMGAVLRFSLRANPTKRVASPGERSDGKRHDVVMAAKHQLKAKGEAFDLQALVQDEGIRWLERQGERHGFSVERGNVRVDDYRPHRFRRPRDGREMSVTGIDYEGRLKVTDSEAFTEALCKGIGPAKGFGFGLLMVKRA